jgi:hypothetical protein
VERQPAPSEKRSHPSEEYGVLLELLLKWLMDALLDGGPNRTPTTISRITTGAN